MPHTVFFGVPQWRADGPARVTERLVRGLVAHGHDARILLTETGYARGSEADLAMDLPADLRCDRLAAKPDDAWHLQWEALERYLEERAPCHYVLFPGSAMNLATPRFSNRIRFTGVVHADDEITGGDIERVGHLWHAIIALDDSVHFRLISRLPHLASRTVTIRQPADDLDDIGQDGMITEFIRVLDRVEALSRRGGFLRRRRAIDESSAHAVDHAVDVERMTQVVRWPEPPAGALPTHRSTRPSARRLEEHKVIVSSMPGNISGVDVFSAHLVRGLRERGIDARLHGRPPAEKAAVAGLPDDLPFLERDPALDDEYLGWLNRWKLMVQHLERLAPCIYVPNYDCDYSCVAPQFSERVRVVGIGHSDDPWHYEHLCRIGHACDAIVGVSHAITDHLRVLAPEFAQRLETIPYGIPLSPPAANAGTGRSPSPGAGLRIIYSGRLVQPQKRALDLVAIARALVARGVPYELAIVGDGDIRGVLEGEARDLVRSRRLWFTGMQPNSGVLELLEKADAFLLPSAFEGLSVGMLEAMSRGVVPVVSDIRSGVPDVIVPGENGLVAPVGDIGRFADHLEWLWRNPEERARMAAAAATTVAAGYSVENMIDRYVALFRRIVAEPFARPAGPFVPPAHLRHEITWSTWASRIAANPAASVRRVTRRVRQAWR